MLILQGEGERNTTVPSNRQEKLWFIEDSPNVSSLEDLKTAPVLRKRKPMSNKHGVEVDHEDMEKSVNELAAHYAGIPEFAGASFNIVQDGVPKVRFALKPEHKLEIVFLAKDHILQLFGSQI